jgi:hypothetical protein
MNCALPYEEDMKIFAGLKALRSTDHFCGLFTNILQVGIKADHPSAHYKNEKTH